MYIIYIYTYLYIHTYTHVQIQLVPLSYVHKFLGFVLFRSSVRSILAHIQCHASTNTNQSDNSVTL